MDHPWVNKTLPTIDTLLPNNQSSPTSEDPKRTFSVSMHSDTSASHSLPSQQAWELSSQKQHAKDWSHSHCEFQSVTSVVCFSCLVGVSYSFEVWLTSEGELRSLRAAGCRGRCEEWRRMSVEDARGGGVVLFSEWNHSYDALQQSLTRL